MKIKLLQRIISGNLVNAQVGGVYNVDEAFGEHLLEIGVAEQLDSTTHEKKVAEDYEPRKKRQSSQSSEEVKASPKKTAEKRKNTPESLL